MAMDATSASSIIVQNLCLGDQNNGLDSASIFPRFVWNAYLTYALATPSFKSNFLVTVIN